MLYVIFLLNFSLNKFFLLKKRKKRMSVSSCRSCIFVPYRGELSGDVCMCVVNKQFELLEFVFDSVYVDLQYDEISLTFTAGYVDLQYDEIYLTFTAGYVSLCCVCGHVVVFGLSVSLSWYPMWMRWLL